MSLHAEVRSLQPGDVDGEPRTASDARMLGQLLAEVRAGRRVCAAFFGHPGAFAGVPHAAITAARSEGFSAVMEPGARSLRRRATGAAYRALRILRKPLRLLGLCCCLLLPMSVATADTVAQRLAHLDEIKRKDFAGFTTALEALEQASGLTAAEQEYLDYLQSWRAIYSLEYDVALQRLDALIGTAKDSAIRQRASASRVNVLTLSRRYEEAFSALNTMLERLPSMDDPVAREQLLGIAAMLLVDVAEYDQAIRYATQMREARQSPWARCASAMMILEALSGQGTLRADDPRIEGTIRDCEAAGEPLPTGLSRSLQANLQLRAGRAAEVLPRLEAEFGQAQATLYPRLVSEYQSLLAAANLQLGRLAEARTHAAAALEAGRGQLTKPEVDALQLLYRVERAAGNLPAAIDWLERYHDARRRLLDDVGVRQMAYQRVRSEAIAHRMQIEALNRENQLLAIEQRLKDTSLENARLYLVLVLLILTAVLLGAWRIWRVQRQFQLRAENDGLTGIANRTHFLAVAEQRLKQAEQAGRPVALVIIDLDHFKAINDSWGHPAGDQVLKQATAAWAALLKPGEWFGRLGGEEFALLLVGVSMAEAQARAETLRAALARERMALGERVIGITASFGIAGSAQGPYPLKLLLIRADAAMYAAKQAGRDRVVAAAA